MLDDRVDRSVAAVAFDLFVVDRIAEAVEGDVPILTDRRTAQLVQPHESDQRSPDAAMATPLAGGTARLHPPERALEVALRFAGEAFLRERPGQSALAATRNRRHHGGATIG